MRFPTLLDDPINSKNPQPHMVEGFVICNILPLRELRVLDISTLWGGFVYYLYITCTYPQGFMCFWG